MDFCKRHGFAMFCGSDFDMRRHCDCVTLRERERFVEAPSSQILANTQNIRQLQIGETLRIKPKPDKTCEKEASSLS